MSTIESDPVKEMRRLISIIEDAQYGKEPELGALKTDPRVIEELSNRQQKFENLENNREKRELIDKIKFEEFTIPIGNAEEIKFSPVNKDGRAEYLKELDQYVVVFNVFNGGFIGYLEVFLKLSEEKCIWRFTNYKCDKNAHFISENMNILLAKSLDMDVAKYAGKLAAKYYVTINSSKNSSEWERIDQPLELARAV